jgi:cell division protein FtsQ
LDAAVIDQGRLAGRSFPHLLRAGRGRPRRGRARLLSPRVIIVLIAVLLLFGGAWLWFRDSSLVAIKRVQVTGATGPDAGRIRQALIVAARNMTTLDVSIGELRTAVAPYPDVKNVRVSTQFPHGMRIFVVEQRPVAAVLVAGRTIAVAGDGTLLSDTVPTAALPRIPLAVPPGGARLTGSAQSAVDVLAAAPYQLLPRLTEVTTTARHGLTAQLRSGPSIYFGDAQRLAAKWSAAVAVLGDPSSGGAVYVDVSDPIRPAAGGGTSGSSTAGGTTTGGGAGAVGTSSTSAPPGG